MYHIKRGASIHLFHLPLNYYDHHSPKLKWHHYRILLCSMLQKFFLIYWSCFWRIWFRAKMSDKWLGFWPWIHDLYVTGSIVPNLFKSLISCWAILCWEIHSCSRTISMSHFGLAFDWLNLKGKCWWSWTEPSKRPSLLLARSPNLGHWCSTYLLVLEMPPLPSN